MDNEFKIRILELLREKLQRIGIREAELDDNFDLVKSGLLNSLEFVDIIASLEKIYAVEIDFEQALDKGGLTTLGGLIRTFESKK
jgi:acyl carrier protein